MESLTVNDYIGLHANDMGFDAHLTIMYFGTLDKDRFEYTMDVLKNIEPTIFFATRTGIKSFGKKLSVPVVTVKFEDTSMNSFLRYLDEWDITSNSEHSWNPHITIKLDHSETIMIPEYIKLSNLYLKYDGVKHYVNSRPM